MDSIIYPMSVHVLFIALLYALLTIARAPKVWNIGTDKNTWQKLEPRISANLANQFEWPVLFYVVCMLLLMKGLESQVTIGLAWLFCFGRLLHSLVQIFTENIRLRGLIFTINFLAVLAMWYFLLAGI